MIVEPAKRAIEYGVQWQAQRDTALDDVLIMLSKAPSAFHSAGALQIWHPFRGLAESHHGPSLVRPLRSHFRIGAAARVPQSKYFNRRLTSHSVVKVIMDASQVNASHIF